MRGGEQRGGSGAAASSRKLRRTVRALRGCLAALPRLEARVLRLRAGIGRARPHSTAAVARIVDRPLRQVRRVQRRALRHLRRDGRDGCAGAAAAPDGEGATATLGGTGTGLAALGDTGAGVNAGADGTGAAAGGGGTDHPVDTKDGGSSGVLGAQNDRERPPAGALPDVPGGVDPTLPVLLMLLAALFVAHRLRQRGSRPFSG
jgi:hypothetical protein